MISNISFGSKIPVSNFNVYNRFKNDYENVTMYCLDCKDESDIYEVASASVLGKYLKQFIALVKTRYSYFLTKNRLPEDIWEKYFTKEDEPTLSIFIVKNSNDDTIGICQAEPHKNGNGVDRTIEFIETNKNGTYKYVGQGIVASLGKMLSQEENAGLFVYKPIENAMDFYVNCGFRGMGPDLLSMDTNGMNNLVDDFENKTKGKIMLY